MDEDGVLFILDRKKICYWSTGFNVYPDLEIEDVIAHYPGVVEVAVIGVPDEHSFQVPKAVIVVDNSEITKEQIIAYCRKNLTPYKIPKHIEFVKELPKTQVGKVLRRVLRDSHVSEDSNKKSPSV